MGSGKGGSPSAPDYSPIAQSSLEAANVQAGVSREQLDWAKQQYADQKPYTDAFMTAMTGAQEADLRTQLQSQKDALEAQDYYKETYRPMETQFARTAQGYASPDRASEQAAAAQANVMQAGNAQREAALQGLEGYGIDPSQTRYGALDLGARITLAASSAAAGTQSRLNTEGTALGLQGEALNMGRGYPGQVAQSYGTSINAGQGAAGAGGAGVNAGLNTFQTGGNEMGGPAQWASVANQSRGVGANAMNMGFQNALASSNSDAAIGQNAASGIGGLAGAGIVAAGLAVGV